MKKRLYFAAVAATALLVIFASCNNDPQEVKIAGQATAGGPSKVTAVQLNDKSGTIVSWEAAQNAVDYNVYWQLKDKKTINIANSAEATNRYIYSVAGGQTLNADSDKWNAFVDYAGSLQVGQVRFGVQAMVITPGGALEGMGQVSDIVWSDYIAVAAYSY